MTGAYINHIVLLGKQGSGKTSIAKELEHRGFKRVVAMTTRPPRDGEENGMDYWFVNDTEFDASLDDLVAVKTYQTIFGTWRYGVNLHDINADDDTVTILDPTGYLNIKDHITDRFGVYLHIDDRIRYQRLLLRGDDPDEIDRRERDDAPQFAMLEERLTDVLELMSNGQRWVNFDEFSKGGYSTSRTVSEETDRILRYMNAFNRGEINYERAPRPVLTDHTLLKSDCRGLYMALNENH